jgi:Putative esterase
VIVAAVRWVPLRVLVVFLGVVVFTGFGLLGVYRYVDGYWLSRGFPPPSDPAYVARLGVEQTITVSSSAIGRRQQVDVYLPPNYSSHPRRRYPVLYLLHGEPGRPAAFL